MKKSSMVFACLLLTGACSKVKELEKRTENMENSTTEMSSTTNEMKKTTSVMYEQLRLGNSAMIRLENFEHLINPNINIEYKLAAASTYYQAFEFQLMTDEELEDYPELRDMLLLDAANQYAKHICGAYKKLNVGKMSPTMKDSSHNDEMIFYALAATVHMNNHYQELVVKSDSSLTTYSMYNMIKNALTKDVNKSALKDYEKLLVNGTSKKAIIDLLKARVDFLGALALKNLTDKDEMNLSQKAKGAIFKITGGRLGGIDLPELYNESNDTTKEQTIKYLDAALSTKKFLVSIGVEKPLEKTLKSAFKHIDFDEANSHLESERKEIDVNKDKIKSLIDGLME